MRSDEQMGEAAERLRAGQVKKKKRKNNKNWCCAAVLFGALSKYETNIQ